jgi:tetratricopeptide (TPR) repeat protein
MRRHRVVRATIVIVVAAAAILSIGAAFGRQSGPPPRQVAERAASGPAASADPIVRAQERLRLVPRDWRTWAGLAVAYLERGRTTADPSYYPKADEAVRRSLALRPDDNADASVARGALANARHDFAAARRDALAATRLNAYGANAYAVLADAETQLGRPADATAAVQRLLDLRPGLSAYARGSYDLEQRGALAAATDLMRRALDAAMSPSDIAFCRGQLGDLAWLAGDLSGAAEQYAAGLGADPHAVSLLRGRARVAAASGRLDAAIADYADVTRRSPTAGYLLEYAGVLRAAGRTREAAEQLALANDAQRLFVANGGVDGLTAAELAIEAGRPSAAVAAARAEWARRRHPDVADILGWALHLAARDGEALRYARLAGARGALSATYAYHVGMIELSLGQRRAACADLERALRRNPAFSPIDAPAARRALAGLGGVR